MSATTQFASPRRPMMIMSADGIECASQAMRRKSASSANVAAYIQSEIETISIPTFAGPNAPRLATGCQSSSSSS